MNTDDSLLHRVAQGDARAFRACMQSHARLVRSIARRLLRGDAELDDATQDVFVAVWRSAGRYDGRVDERAFIAMIARRRLIDRLRTKRRRPITSPLDDSPGSREAADAVEACGEAVLASKHLGALRPAERRVIMLSAVGGMSHSEISSELGLPLGTVKTYASRGMAQLRRALSA